MNHANEVKAEAEAEAEAQARQLTDICIATAKKTVALGSSAGQIVFRKWPLVPGLPRCNRDCNVRQCMESTTVLQPTATATAMTGCARCALRPFGVPLPLRVLPLPLDQEEKREKKVKILMDKPAPSNSNSNPPTLHLALDRRPLTRLLTDRDRGCLLFVSE